MSSGGSASGQAMLLMEAPPRHLKAACNELSLLLRASFSSLRCLILRMADECAAILGGGRQAKATERKLCRDNMRASCHCRVK